jgi:hypothetical protein
MDDFDRNGRVINIKLNLLKDFILYNVVFIFLLDQPKTIKPKLKPYTIH